MSLELENEIGELLAQLNSGNSNVKGKEIVRAKLRELMCLCKEEGDEDSLRERLEVLRQETLQGISLVGASANSLLKESSEWMVGKHCIYNNRPGDIEGITKGAKLKVRFTDGKKPSLLTYIHPGTVEIVHES